MRPADLSGRARTGPTPVVPPDQAVDPEVLRQGAQAGNPRQADEPDAEQDHQPPDLDVRVVRRREGRDLVPEGVEPQPWLTGIVARLVHDAPLVAAEVLGPGLVLQMGTVREQEQRLGAVDAEEAGSR